MAKYAVPALIALIALLGGFYGGFRFGQTNASASSAGAGPGAAAANASPGAGRNACSTAAGNGRNGANANRATVFGQITDVAGNVLTIHNPTCNTDAKVTLSGNAVIRKSVDGTTADLANGTNVTIQGTKGADGTITANNASILPPGQTFPTGGASPGAGGNGGGGGFGPGGGGGGVPGG